VKASVLIFGQIDDAAERIAGLEPHDAGNHFHRQISKNGPADACFNRCSGKSPQ
jgi:hypothetical protein